jgi:hypothetical protein
MQAVQVKTVPEIVHVRQLATDPVIPVVEAEHETGTPAFKTYPGLAVVHEVALTPHQHPAAKAVHEERVLVNKNPELH